MISQPFHTSALQIVTVLASETTNLISLEARTRPCVYPGKISLQDREALSSPGITPGFVLYPLPLHLHSFLHLGIPGEFLPLRKDNF